MVLIPLKENTIHKLHIPFVGFVEGGGFLLRSLFKSKLSPLGLFTSGAAVVFPTSSAELRRLKIRKKPILKRDEFKCVLMLNVKTLILPGLPMGERLVGNRGRGMNRHI